MTSLDKLFERFATGLFILLVLYGFGMIIVVILEPNELASKLVNVWSGMFGAVVGLGSGYLLGRAQNKFEEEDTPDERANRNSDDT